ncbi:MAG: MATE family efflux transporter, partial [Clostridia bacterium]|nr:MATE family efflux transporter [Clostridia bacterium]
TNFVSLLDNVMVGRLGTDPMNGVAIVNQLIFVFAVSIFGGVSGAGIFGAQFYGRKDHDGVRHTFRFKLICCALITALAVLVLLTLQVPLVSLFLHEGSRTGNIGATMGYARQYLLLMIAGLPPFALSQVYASTLRETGQTVVPMNASILAVGVNLGLNYILIYGKLGFPAMGVRGAALATVIARYAECVAVARWTHAHEESCPFAIGLYQSLRIPRPLAKNILSRGTPLLLNEMLWSLGMAVLAQCYSVRGLAAVAAYNISSTVTNLFNVAFIAVGGSIAIIVGNLLGAGKMEEAKRTDTWLIVFSVLLCILVAGLMAVASPFIPQTYNTSAEVRGLARDFILITALAMPLHAFVHAAYFTLRSGGKTGLTFVFDCGFMWVASIPVAWALSRFTGLPIRPLFALVQAVDVLKCLLGYRFVKSNIWLNNIVVKN